MCGIVSVQLIGVFPGRTGRNERKEKQDGYKMLGAKAG